MKKRIALLLVFLCLAVVLEPAFSRAEDSPAFIAINDTILPFNDDYMPFAVGGMVYVPAIVFKDLNIYAEGSAETERMVMYTGAGSAMRFLEFSTRPGYTSVKDQNNNTLSWPAARRIGRRFYVPLRHVCEFFGLQVNAYEISRDIIPDRQISLVRIWTDISLSAQTLINRNRNALRAAYEQYYAPPVTPPPTVTPGGPDEPPPEIDEPPPVYSDVSIFLSFYDVSAGSAEWIMDRLDIQATFGYHTCFFVSADDVLSDPGLIRRISGAGHTIGIRLKEGTLDEFNRTSELLFEATKIRTVLVTVIEETGSEDSGDDAAERETITVDVQLLSSGLIVWGCSQNLNFINGSSEPDITGITDKIPTETGERYSLMFPCSEEAALVLPGVITFLTTYEYSLEKITETTDPIFPKQQ